MINYLNFAELRINLRNNFMETQTEIWKQILDTNYAISNFGRVKQVIKNKILKISPTTRGYEKATIFLKDGTKKYFAIHRLVAIAFIPFNIPNMTIDLTTVNHKDGNKLNNHVSNLEWMTSSDNLKHAYQTGLNNSTGENNNSSKYSSTQIKEVCQMIKDGYRNIDISKATNVHHLTISDIRNLKNWTSISSSYFTEKVKPH